LRHFLRNSRVLVIGVTVRVTVFEIISSEILKEIRYAQAQHP
jgi:hypothetical protein